MRAILTYHSIDPSGSPISCHPDSFDQHVKWLTSGRVKVTTIDELVALPPSADAVAITFDDGFVNFREIAAPRLLAAGLPVTIFVVADHVGATNAWGGRPEPAVPHLPLLDWPALVRLQEHGVVLGAHTRTHPDLTRLGAAAVEKEVVGSAEVIERRTGRRPQIFAYPYGRIDDQAARMVGRVFSFGCTTEFRVLDGNVLPAHLPRLDMYYFSRATRLEQWGTPGLDRFVKARHRLRRLRGAARKAGEVLTFRTAP